MDTFSDPRWEDSPDCREACWSAAQSSGPPLNQGYYNKDGRPRATASDIASLPTDVGRCSSVRGPFVAQVRRRSVRERGGDTHIPDIPRHSM